MELLMNADDPVSLWIDELKRGEDSAARKIWNHYVEQLYEVARKKLRPGTRRVYDEQDAAQSAFHALCAGVSAGRFPDLADRTNLWRLLLTITSRKICNRHRYDYQEQRDIRRTHTDSVFLNPGQSGFINRLPAHQPSPEFAAEFVELCGSLFEGLGDPELQRIGWLKFEGYNDQEIADQLGCARRTIQRKVERIRRHWQEAHAEEPEKVA